MAPEFDRPVRMPSSRFDAFTGSDDPAARHRVTHDTAWALLNRVRETDDPALVDRVVGYADQHGIDTIAELWLHASPHSLPGALWRLYLLRTLVRRAPEETSLVFRRGTEVLPTIDALVAGAPQPTGPEELIEVTDRIFRGVFEGDFAIALDRAAAFCRIEAAGLTSLADDQDAAASERAAEFTRRALRYSELAVDLTASARLWRSDSLD